MNIIVNFKLNRREKESQQNLNELMSNAQQQHIPIKSDVEANSKDLISIHIFSLITISHSEMYVMITTHHIRNDELRLVRLTLSLLLVFAGFDAVAWTGNIHGNVGLSR